MPVVIYMEALAVWILVACMIWCAAGLMFVVPRTRPFAWPMSLAIAATFPFVFAYQIMAAPVVLTILLGAFALWRLLEPVSTKKNPVVAGGFFIAIIGSAIIMFVASLAGFADGWRTGWGLARGRPINETLSYTIPKKCLDRLMSRCT
jgi:ABC-type phosphate transport system permease subunit